MPDSDESGEPVRLSSAEERELVEAMDQIRRGEYVDGQDLLNELRFQREPQAKL